MESSLVMEDGASAGKKPRLPVVRPAELLLQPACRAVPASSNAHAPAWANRFILTPVRWRKCAKNTRSVNPACTRLKPKLWRNGVRVGATHWNLLGKPTQKPTA